MASQLTNSSSGTPREPFEFFKVAEMSLSIYLGTLRICGALVRKLQTLIWKLNTVTLKLKPVIRKLRIKQKAKKRL